MSSQPALGDDDLMETGSEDGAHPLPTNRALTLIDRARRRLSLPRRLAKTLFVLRWPAQPRVAGLGRKAPLRLLASPDDPFAGNAARGKAIRAGYFLCEGSRLPLRDGDQPTDWAGAGCPAPFCAYVHSFAWLRDLALSGPRDQTTQLAATLLGEWLDAQDGDDKRATTEAWQSAVAAQRIMAWAVHAPLLLGGDDSALRTRMLRSMAQTARRLDKSADKAETRMDRMIGWCGVIAAGLILPDREARQKAGETGLKRALATLMAPDGGVRMRDPLVQMRMIEQLIELRAFYTARDQEPCEALTEALRVGVPALTSLVMGDGGLGSWQGAPPLPAARINALVAASDVRARPLRHPKEWGFQRLPAGNSVLIADAGPPPVARQSGTGCASTLAFELSHGDKRIIVNCGGAAASRAHVPHQLSEALRATAAHSTLCLADQNSTAVLADGKLGTGVVEVEVNRREIANATRLEMAHDGYEAQYGFGHRRILLLRADGLELRGEDLLVPGQRKSRKKRNPFAIRFHLAPHVEAHRAADGLGALLRLGDGSLWQFRSMALGVELDDSLWVDGAGKPRRTKQIVMTGHADRGGGSFGWLLKHMG